MKSIFNYQFTIFNDRNFLKSIFNLQFSIINDRSFLGSIFKKRRVPTSIFKPQTSKLGRLRSAGIFPPAFPRAMAGAISGAVPALRSRPALLATCRHLVSLAKRNLYNADKASREVSATPSGVGKSASMHMASGCRNIFKHGSVKMRVLTFVMCLSALLLPMQTVLAQTMSTTFQSRSPLTAGTVVALNETNAEEVIPASLNNLQHLHGVVVNEGEAVVNISNQENGVEVATSGTVNVVVSNVNGAITSGDLITASPIGGVAMRAADQAKVLGTAQANFSADSNAENIRTIPVTLNDGRTIDVTIGAIPVAVNVQNNPNIAEDEILPEFLQNTANTISGKPVSTTRVIVSFIIFLLTLIGATVLIYSAVQSAVISIGRNPLSKGSVYRSLFQVFGIVVIVMAVGLGSAYLVLR